MCLLLATTMGCNDNESTSAPTSVSGDLSAVAPSTDMAGAPPSTFPRTASVTVGAGNTLTFTPGTVDIAAGGSVTWTWASENTLAHNVTSGDTPPAFAASPTVTSGTYSVTFANAGTFFYYCTVHGRNVMFGTVNVH
jgi:plastocyanin